MSLERLEATKIMNEVNGMLCSESPPSFTRLRSSRPFSAYSCLYFTATDKQPHMKLLSKSAPPSLTLTCWSTHYSAAPLLQLLSRDEQSKITTHMFRCPRKNCGAYITRHPKEGNGGVLCDFHQRELFLSIRAMCRHWNKWYTPQGASPVNWGDETPT
jgi:hypothetical protein